MSDNDPAGRIFNIQAYSVHDGPGIRTVCFLKGCPLRCKWCSNPESQSADFEIACDARKCVQCQKCVSACPAGFVNFSEDAPVVAREACNPAACPAERSCTDVCSARALFMYGSMMTVAEVLTRVEEDAAFYGRSGGGLTVSGGEPLMQPAFTVPLLQRAHGMGIHTCIETTAFAPRDVFLSACAHLDFLITDIKHMNPQAHQYWTGVSNRQILANIAAARDAFPGLPLLVRTPLIPGVNDTEEDISEIAVFVKNLGNAEYELLPYHALGAQKYAYLGRKYELGDVVCTAGKTDEMQAVANRIMAGARAVLE